MTFTNSVAGNNWGTAKWIVSPTIGQGTHQTIASALTSASSGDTIFIRPSTYTENLTLKAGVNLCAYECDALTPNVTIVGKCTATFAGTCSISGIRLQTNSDNLLAVTGSNATIIYLENCYLNCTNSTGISYTTSNASSVIRLLNCIADLTTTGIALYSSSSAGTIIINNCTLNNSGASVTANSNSAGAFVLNGGFHGQIFATSSTGSAVLNNTQISSASNAVCLTTAGTGTADIQNSYFNSGSGSSISVGSGTTVTISSSTVQSTNTNPITGLGTVTYSSVCMISTGIEINTTTQTARYTHLGKYRATGQPAFLATHTSAQTDVTGDGTAVTVNFTTEVFDQDNNYDATNTFTAPVTGRYSFNASVRCDQIGAGMTQGQIAFITSNRNYVSQVLSYVAIQTVGNIVIIPFSILADMDAADTCLVQITITGGTKTVDFSSAATQTFFSGMLEA